MLLESFYASYVEAVKNGTTSEILAASHAYNLVFDAMSVAEQEKAIADGWFRLSAGDQQNTFTTDGEIMEKLSRSELEKMFIEMVQDCYEDDTIQLFGCSYSKVEMLKDHDPICFNMALDEWLDNETQDERFTEINGEYYLVA